MNDSARSRSVVETCPPLLLYGVFVSKHADNRTAVGHGEGKSVAPVAPAPVRAPDDVADGPHVENADPAEIDLGIPVDVQTMQRLKQQAAQHRSSGETEQPRESQQDT